MGVRKKLEAGVNELTPKTAKGKVLALALAGALTFGEAQSFQWRKEATTVPTIQSAEHAYSLLQEYSGSKQRAESLLDEMARNFSEYQQMNEKAKTYPARETAHELFLAACHKTIRKNVLPPTAREKTKAFIATMLYPGMGGPSSAFMGEPIEKGRLNNTIKLFSQGALHDLIASRQKK